MSNEKPKSLKDITDVDVKRVAIARAAEAGWTIGLDDCQVQKGLPRRILSNEIGLGATTTNLGILDWTVYIKPKTPPNKYVAQLVVTVEFAWNELGVMDFDGPEHPY